MDKEYYKEYYKAEREHWFFKSRNDIIMNLIEGTISDSNMKNVSILNIGVATGYTSVLLKEMGSITSIEFDEDCFNFTKEIEKDINLQRGSILDLDFDDNSFDIVCAFDVVEHVKEDNIAIKEMERVCKNDGHIFATVPAFMSLWSQHDVINHHFKRYRQKQFNQLFSNPQNVTYTTYFNFWLFLPILFIRTIKNIFSSTKVQNPENAESDLKMFSGSTFISSLFYKVLISENWFIKKKINLPFGVSILTSYSNK